MHGSSETTFYVLTVYLGAVGIRRSLHAVPLLLFGDLVGYVAALWMVKLFFEPAREGPVPGRGRQVVTLGKPGAWMGDAGASGKGNLAEWANKAREASRYAVFAVKGTMRR